MSHFRDLIERAEPLQCCPIANAIRGDRRTSIRSALPDEVLTSTQPLVLRGLVATGRWCARAANRPRRPTPTCALLQAMRPWSRCSARRTSAAASSTTTTSPASISSRCACRLDAVLDELARYRDDAHAAGDLRRLHHHRHVPAGLSRRERSRLRRSRSRSPASGSAIARASPRTTICRTTSPASSPAVAASRCFRPSSWRICTSARSTSRRPARPISLVDFAQPDFATLPALRRRRCEHAQVAELGPGDAIFIPEHVVASHRVARRLQRAGQLLVAPVAGVHGFADRTRSCSR